jgi:hypothetical protein
VRRESNTSPRDRTSSQVKKRERCGGPRSICGQPLCRQRLDRRHSERCVCPRLTSPLTESFYQSVPVQPGDLSLFFASRRGVGCPGSHRPSVLP